MDYVDGDGNAWRVNNFAVEHLEKVIVRNHYDTVDGEQVEDVSKRKSYGRKVTSIRIASIKEPFNGTQLKMERLTDPQAKLAEWGLTAVVAP